MKFCLIGEKLGHSFSVPIHRFYGAEYELREIARDSLGDFVKNCPFDGFNVTIPYKTEIMRYLDEVDSRAAKIGSVNTVVYRGGKSVGYNTDIDGMAEMLAFQGIPLGDDPGKRRNGENRGGARGGSRGEVCHRRLPEGKSQLR